MAPFFEPSQLRNFNFDVDPVPAFHSDADPDLAYQNETMQVRIREPQKHVAPDSDPNPQHWYSPSGSVLSFLLGGVRAGDISSLQSMLLVVVVLVLLLLPSEQRMDKFNLLSMPDIRSLP